jgi:hypothetical protein
MSNLLSLTAGTDIDTKMMHYHEHGCYIRILRLAFAIERKPSSGISPIDQEPSTSSGLSEGTDATKTTTSSEESGPLQACWLHRTLDADHETNEDDGNAPEAPRHPDDEQIPASEEQAREEEKRQQRLRSRCTCKAETANALVTRKSDQPLLLSSTYFSSLRRNETIQQMQQRIHEYVAGPVNGRLANQRRAAIQPVTSGQS